MRTFNFFLFTSSFLLPYLFIILHFPQKSAFRPWESCVAQVSLALPHHGLCSDGEEARARLGAPSSEYLPEDARVDSSLQAALPVLARQDPCHLELTLVLGLEPRDLVVPEHVTECSGAPQQVDLLSVRLVKLGHGKAARSKGTRRKERKEE